MFLWIFYSCLWQIGESFSSFSWIFCVGFQFDVYGEDITITNIVSEYPESAGLTIISSEFSQEGFTRVLAYYDYELDDELTCEEGAENGCMRSGCGILLSFSYTGNIDRIRNIVFGGSQGQLIPMSYY